MENDIFDLAILPILIGIDKNGPKPSLTLIIDSNIKVDGTPMLFIPGVDNEIYKNCANNIPPGVEVHGVMLIQIHNKIYKA